MNEQVQTFDYYVLSAEQRNRVMRNTYWLLALSMVPTVLGAWLGVYAGLGQIFSGGLGMILMLAGAFGFIYAIERTKESITGVYVLLVGSVINMFTQSSTGMIVISMLSIAIFSAYMLYDLKQIVDGGETNYISATLTLYLDIINVFQSLLALLGIFGGERE